MKNLNYPTKICFAVITFWSSLAYSNVENIRPQFANSDTIIVKKHKVLNKSYEQDLYAKSITYYLVVNNDTLDFRFEASAYKDDGRVGIYLLHKQPVEFAKAMQALERSFPIIKQDFDISKISSIYTRELICYDDLAQSVNSQYLNKYGSKIVSYAELNIFLKKSTVDAEVNKIFKPLGIRSVSYFIEKFHLIEKKHFGTILKNTNFTNYPDYSIHGMGIAVKLKNM